MPLIILCNGFGITSALDKHMVDDDILFTNHLVGKWEILQRGHGVLSFHIVKTWFKLAVTSSNSFLLVVVHNK